MLFTAAMLFAVQCGEKTGFEKDLEVKPSLIPSAGKGLFTKVRIPKGSYLGHYTGRFITDKEHDRLFKEDKWHYVMGLLDCAAKNTGGYTLIDGVNGNIFSRLNHAPREFQNVRFLKICEYPYVKIIALRDIEPGEELYVDYGPDYIYDFMEIKEVKDFFKNKSRGR